MRTAPKGTRLHIGIFGRRNVGKSSVLNAFTGQEVSIVSETAGTTTDPVEKAMELLPIGPVLFIDTAGIDDEGALGAQRIERSRRVINRTDVALLVVDHAELDEFERHLIAEFQERKTPVVVVFNKSDVYQPSKDTVDQLRKDSIGVAVTSATTGEGIDDLFRALIGSVSEEFLTTPTIVGDILPAGELAVLVVPIDLEAPKGRLILPQVQTIRDVLDNDGYCMMVKEHQLKDALNRLNRPPKIVITDSQAFSEVGADVPRDVPLTSFSILFARLKGDLRELVRGAFAIENLKKGDRVLIFEACTHHPVEDDIGRVKIPRWLQKYVGEDLEFDHYQGHDVPANIADYRLVIHCGGCVHNRREMLTRIALANRAGVPITNYGLAIAYTLGIFERALEPFPAVADLVREHFPKKS